MFSEKKGQTIIELIIALFIITTGVVSLVSLSIRNIATVQESEDSLVATYIAKEGIEIVRNNRDTNWMLGSDFFGLYGDDNIRIMNSSGIVFWGTPDWFEENGALPNLAFFDLTFNNEETDIYLYNNELVDENERFLYYYNGWMIADNSIKTKFKRLMFLENICLNKLTGAERLVPNNQNCDETENLVGVNVNSSVKWKTSAGNEKIVKAQEKLYDWR